MLNTQTHIFDMSLRLGDFDAIGFDVDHTLVHYKLEHLYPVVYHGMATYLVEEFGYPEQLATEPFDKYADFCMRGLIFETKKGNFLKVDKNGKILRGSHGTRAISDEELRSEYGKDLHWQHLQEFVNDKSRFLRNPDFAYMVDNFFDAPAMVLCARIVDFMDDENVGKDKYSLIWPQILSGFIKNFDFRAFPENTGNFYPALKRDILKYVHRCTEKVKNWLRRLRAEGKKLFLATNSQADFSIFVLEAAFGKDWRSYFDVAISRANKPGFFEHERPFFEVVDGVTQETGEGIRDLELDKYYAEGNSKDLDKFLGKLCGKPHDEVKVLFFGDSLRSDVRAPSLFTDKWQSVALVEEMVFEVEEPILNHVNKTEKDNARLKLYLESDFWGVMCSDGEKVMENLYAGLVDQHSSLVIPGLDYIADLQSDHEFVPTNGCTSSLYPELSTMGSVNR